MNYIMKVARYQKLLTAVLVFCSLSVAGLAQELAPATEVTAIDILLKPDATMMHHAGVANAKLLKDYPEGFSLDATHAPHVTVVQAFVKTAELDKIKAAISAIAAEEKPTDWTLTATGYYDIPLGERGLAGIVVQPTPDLLQLQQKVLEAIEPYRADQSISEAFVPRPDGQPIMQPTIDYVKTFAEKSTGEHYNPHVTIGWGNRPLLDQMKAEQFESFTFKPAAMEIFQLGEYGTAQKCLWSSAPADPLSSWNDTAPKQAIVAFVEKVTTPGSPDFVPEPERIAVFDNDGTLWSEQPAYFQLFFAIDRVKALAPDHPEWQTNEPFASVLKGDMEGLAATGDKGLLQLIAATHAGMTTEEFTKEVTDWMATAKHPTTGKPFTEMIYQPMHELLDYLRANGFKTFIVSGGGIEFMRPWTEKTYGIPPEQVIGSSLKMKYEVRDGQPVLVKLPEIDLIDDGAGKPVGIQSHIGRRPIFAAGNSDGDFQMLEWTTSGSGPRFAMIVHHTDGDREWAYDRKSAFGKLDKALDEAPQRGWIVVSMKDDWNTIFPE